jgi:hypothetical protein
MPSDTARGRRRAAAVRGGTGPVCAGAPSPATGLADTAETLESGDAAAFNRVPSSSSLRPSRATFRLGSLDAAYDKKKMRVRIRLFSQAGALRIATICAPAWRFDRAGE